MTRREKKKIKALFDAIRALQKEGYSLRDGRIYREVSEAYPKVGKPYKVRVLSFTLDRLTPLDDDDMELCSAAKSLHTYEKQRLARLSGE